MNSSQYFWYLLSDLIENQYSKSEENGVGHFKKGFVKTGAGKAINPYPANVENRVSS